MKPSETIATRSARNRRQKSCSGERAAISPRRSSMLAAAAPPRQQLRAPKLMPIPFGTRHRDPSSTESEGYHTAPRLSSSNPRNHATSLTARNDRRRPERRARPTTRDGRYALDAAALVAQWIEHAPPKRGMQVRFLPGASEPCRQRRVWRKHVATPAPCYRPRYSVSESTLEAPTIPEPAPRTRGRREPAPWTLRASRATTPGGRPARWSSDLGPAGRCGRDASGLRPLRLAGLGPPDLRLTSTSVARPRGSRCRICSRCRTRSSATTSCGCGCSPPSAVALSGVVFAGGSPTGSTRRPRAGARRYARASPRVIAGRGCWDQRLHALHPQRPVRPDDRHAVLAAIDMSPLGTLPLGVRVRRARRPRAARGVAVPRGLYGLWAWRKVRAMRWMLVAWRGGDPVHVVRDPDHHQRTAAASPESSPGVAARAPSQPVRRALSRFHDLQYIPLWIAAASRSSSRCSGAIARCWCWPRGRRRGWSSRSRSRYHGWPALPRYMFEPRGVVAVLAGVAVGWLLLELPRRRAAYRAGPAGGRRVLVWLVPGALAPDPRRARDLSHEHARTHQITLLQSDHQRAGRRAPHPATAASR